MKINKWTLGLAAAGVVSLSSVVQAEEAAHQVLTALSTTTISGYVSTSAIWQLGTQQKGVGAGRAAALPYRAYDGTTKMDSFNLDVVNLTISKNVDEGDWGAGYKAELLFGPDAAAFGTLGFGNSNIKQAYVELRAPVGNGIDFKVGVWDTPIGYEVFNAGDNPNYSRSYGYVLEPTTYTGILASYKAADFLSLWAGVADNSGVGAGAVSPAIGGTAFGISGSESQKSYMGGLTLTAPDSPGFLSGSTLSAGVIDHASQGANANIVNYYVGVTMKTGLEGLTAGASFDYQGRDQSVVAGVTASPSYYANAVAGYLTYKATDKLTAALRGEYASGTAASAGAPFGSAHTSNTELLEATATVDYKLWENVISRVEMRWDHDASGGAGVYGTAATVRKNAVQVALNLIYKF